MPQISFSDEIREVLRKGLTEIEEGKIQYQLAENWIVELQNSNKELSGIPDIQVSSETSEIPQWLADVLEDDHSDLFDDKDTKAFEAGPSDLSLDTEAQLEELPDWLRSKGDLATVPESLGTNRAVLPNLSKDMNHYCKMPPRPPQNELDDSDEWGDIWSEYKSPEIDRKIIYVIGMSEDFIQSIRKVDANIRGRILVAMSDLSRNPTSVQGDTIKPLQRDRRGLWRYRIGDYRLIYQPDEKKHLITLLAFASRSSVYDD